MYIKELNRYSTDGSREEVILKIYFIFHLILIVHVLFSSSHRASLHCLASLCAQFTNGCEKAFDNRH